MPSVVPSFVPLQVAVIGGGLGGCSAAIALRRQGHNVTIYERRDFSGEVGGSISCAANGTQWLSEWGVDISAGKPIMRDWRTGDVMSTYDLSDYKERWGTEYYMFHRQDMHKMLMDCALSQEGEGPPVKFVPFAKCASVDCEAGVVTFEDGREITADLVVGADGVSSKVRTAIGVVPDMAPAGLTCYRCNVEVPKLKELGLTDFSAESAIDYWGGFIVKEASIEEMCSYFPELDPKAMALLENSIERMPWRLWIHQPYSHWTKGRTLVLGDAAHPMLPNQSQGACMALEDAAALGIIFSKDYTYTQSPEAVSAGVKLYEEVRKDRATQVQAASLRATDDINERIGFSSLPEADVRAAFKSGKLTINWMNEYNMKDHVKSLAASA
ncbi:hypothetical protein RQP46_000936 [Phenoliferia psychrophenolica]